MAKSPDAFRTISEVADWLGIQAHVLRFWESKFTQVKPIKRAGGRRYYRPTDMQLLGGIKKLLHDDGLTIKGVQKILREEGMNHVAAMSAPLDELTMSLLADVPAPPPQTILEPQASEKGVVLNFEPPVEETGKEAPEPVEIEPEETGAPPAENATSEPLSDQSGAESTVDDPPAETAAQDATPDPDSAPEPVAPKSPEPEATEEEPETDQPALDLAPRDDATVAPEEDASQAPDQTDQPEQPELEEVSAEPQEQEQDPAPQETNEPAAPLPAFLRQPMVEPEDAAEATDNTPAPAEPAPDAPEPDQSASEASELDEPGAAPATAVKPEPEIQETPQAPKPRVLADLVIPAEDDMAAAPAALSATYRLRQIDAAKAAQIAPLVTQLTALRDSMAARRRGGGTATPNT